MIKNKMILPDNQLIHGDCTEKIKLIPDEYVDLVVTSPPYEDLRSYEGFDFIQFIEFDYELKRVLKPGGIIAWNINDKIKDGDRSCISFKQALHFKFIGFLMHDIIIFKKKGMSYPPNPPARYNQSWEFVFVLSKGKPKTFNPIKDYLNSTYGEKYTGKQREKDGNLKIRTCVKKNKIRPKYSMRSNVWEYNTGYNHSYMNYEKYVKKHPAIMYRKLCEDLIISFSNPGDMVLDPFCGSGTTCMIAKELGRKYIGIEINKEYVELAQRRINDANRRIIWAKNTGVKNEKK